MFINCPHCQALVATDPATELPPPCCPRCAAALNDPAADATAQEAPPTAAPKATRSPASLPTGARSKRKTPAQRIAIGDAAAAGMADGVPCPVASPAPAPATATTGAAVAAATRKAVRDPRPVEIDDVGDTPLAASARPAVTAVAGPRPDGARSDDAPAADDPPAAALDRETAPVVEHAAGTEAHAVARPPAGDAPSSPAAPDRAAAGARARAAAMPNFARRHLRAAAAEGPRRWLLPSLIAGLSLLLALQWLLADRARLAADPRWRPLVAQLCGVLRCALPAWREPAAFALLGRDVRPHPDVPGALRVSARFRNDARWAQPWPEVVLSLSDVEGRTVGARAFAATEYLGAAPTQKVLASGQTATIRMDVLEPAPRIVAFAFDFR